MSWCDVTAHGGCVLVLVLVLVLSHHQPPLITLQPHPQRPGGCSPLRILSWCYQRKDMDVPQLLKLLTVNCLTLSTTMWLFFLFFLWFRHPGGKLMCQSCSRCSAASSWPYPTTSAAKAVIPPSCGQYIWGSGVWSVFTPRHVTTDTRLGWRRQTQMTLMLFFFNVLRQVTGPI